MPVQVTVPTRIRTDVSTLLQKPDDVVESLASAAGRALAHANEAVLAPRGGYVAVTLHAPSFTWRGPGLATVPLACRAELEACLASSLADLAREQGLLQWAQEAGELSLPLGEEPASSANDPAYVQALRRYLLPAYDRAGVRRPVPVQSTRTRAKTRIEVGGWLEFARIDDEMRQAVDEAIARYNLGSATGYVGFMFTHASEMWVYICQAPSLSVVFNLHWKPIQHRHLEMRGNDLRYADDPSGYPVGIYTLRLIRQSHNHQEIVDAYQDWVTEGLRTDAQTLLGDKIALLTATEFETAIGELAHQGFGTEPSDAVTALMEIKGNGITDLIRLGVDVFPEGFTCPVYPLAAWYTREVTLGDGTGEGEDGQRDRARGGEGGPVRYPSRQGGVSELVCQSFEGEPSLTALGDGTEEVRKLIDEIAARLQIEPCEYAGWFALNAAVALGARARGLGEYAAISPDATTVLRPAGGEGKNLGFVHFVPMASPAIILLRRLASVTPLLTRLSHEIDRLYHTQQQRLPDGLIHWQLAFHPQMLRETKFSVADLFLATCRALMLQLLQSSYQAIQGRLKHIDLYAPLFEQMVVNQLTRLDDLLQLRRDLQDERLRRGLTSVGETVAIGYAYLNNSHMAWRDATRQMSDLLKGTTETVGGQERYPLVDGQLHVRDASGTVWSMERLESAIAVQRGTAEDVDPLVKQLQDIPGMMDRFRANRRAIRPELTRLLREMSEHNLEIQGEVSHDADYAFKAGRISANAAEATVPGSGYALQGIHLEAHRQIGEFFHGDETYIFALGMLLRNEDNTRTMTMVAEFVGIILLSIICAPLGAIAGIAAAGYHYSEALEKQALYRALIDPERLISYADVEAELFAAKLGLLLAFIPEVGTILRTGSYGVRAAARAGVVGGVRIVGRYVARRITASIVESLARNLLIAFAREMATALVLQKVIEAMLEPIMAQVQREFQISGSVGGSAGAEATLQNLGLHVERHTPSGGGSTGVDAILQLLSQEYQEGGH